MLTQDAVAFFKGKTKLAKALCITPAAVSQWGPKVPKLRQFEIQALTAGGLKVTPTGVTEMRAA